MRRKEMTDRDFTIIIVYIDVRAWGFKWVVLVGSGGHISNGGKRQPVANG
jgi:hypothetical protein